MDGSKNRSLCKSLTDMKNTLKWIIWVILSLMAGMILGAIGGVILDNAPLW